MSRQAKHRASRRRYPLAVHIYSWRNHWHYFHKPAIKRKAAETIERIKTCLAFKTT